MTHEEILPFLDGWEPQVLDAIAEPLVSAFSLSLRSWAYSS